MTLSWVQSGRLGAADTLQAYLTLIGSIRDAAASSRIPIAALQALEQTQAIIEAILQGISSRRAIGLALGELIRQLTDPLLSDGAYILTYGNLDWVVDNNGVGSLLSNAGDQGVDEDALQYGVYRQYPYTRVSYREGAYSLRRQALYQATNLVENVRMDDFESWLIPVLEAFYDEQDRNRPVMFQRPILGGQDEIGGLFLTITGSDPREILAQYDRLLTLFGLGFEDADRLIAIDGLDDTTGPRAGIRDLDLFRTPTRDLPSSRPDFLRLSTRDLIPGLGNMLDGLLISADLIGPNLPIRIGAEGLIAAIAARITRVLEILDAVTRGLQAISDALTASNVSRLWVPVEYTSVDDFVSAVRASTQTRDDLVRVIANPNGSVGPSGFVLQRGNLVLRSEADTIKSSDPAFVTGPPGNLITYGVMIVLQKGPLADLFEGIFAPNEDDVGEEGGITEEFVERLNADAERPAPAPSMSVRAEATAARPDIVSRPRGATEPPPPSTSTSFYVGYASSVHSSEMMYTTQPVPPSDRFDESGPFFGTASDKIVPSSVSYPDVQSVGHLLSAIGTGDAMIGSAYSNGNRSPLVSSPLTADLEVSGGLQVDGLAAIISAVAPSGVTPDELTLIMSGTWADGSNQTIVLPVTSATSGIVRCASPLPSALDFSLSSSLLVSRTWSRFAATFNSSDELTASSVVSRYRTPYDESGDETQPLPSGVSSLSITNPLTFSCATVDHVADETVAADSGGETGTYAGEYWPASPVTTPGFISGPPLSVIASVDSTSFRPLGSLTSGGAIVSSTCPNSVRRILTSSASATTIVTPFSTSLDATWSVQWAPTKLGPWEDGGGTTGSSGGFVSVTTVENPDERFISLVGRLNGSTQYNAVMYPFIPDDPESFTPLGSDRSVSSSAPISAASGYRSGSTSNASRSLTGVSSTVPCPLLPTTQSWGRWVSKRQIVLDITSNSSSVVSDTYRLVEGVNFRLSYTASGFLLETKAHRALDWVPLISLGQVSSRSFRVVLLVRSLEETWTLSVFSGDTLVAQGAAIYSDRPRGFPSLEPFLALGGDHVLNESVSGYHRDRPDGSRYGLPGLFVKARVEVVL